MITECEYKIKKKKKNEINQKAEVRLKASAHILPPAHHNVA